VELEVLDLSDKLLQKRYLKEILKNFMLLIYLKIIWLNLVRDIRSSFGYIDGDFQTFALDIGSIEYDAFIKSDGKYDYVLNLIST
jgi:hypothetical protein